MGISKSKLIALIIAPVVLTGAIFVYRNNRISSVEAAGILTINFQGSPVNGNPIFTIDNMMPGNTEVRDIEVKNNDKAAQLIAVKADEKEEKNDLAEVLTIEIKENSTTLYGPKVLNNFYQDSLSKNGITLTTVNKNASTHYQFIVHFPETADNRYQSGKAVFDLKFGTIFSDELVINEVYYDVDSAHGMENGKDCCGGNIDAEINGNGAGSKNIINISVNNTCLIVQTNNSNLNTSVNTSNKTGGNKILGGAGTVTTGNSKTKVTILNTLNVNYGSCNGLKTGINDEWVEIYNPTGKEINLKDWTLMDNSGVSIKLPAKKLKAGQFALISKDAATWKYWNDDPDALKISTGKEFGDGLDNKGDHLILSSPGNEYTDKVGWGNDTDVWTDEQPTATEGQSIEREITGVDNDLASDWVTQLNPDPGR